MTGPRVAAALVHVYTASGVLLALAATMEICSAVPGPAAWCSWRLRQQ